MKVNRNIVGGLLALPLAISALVASPAHAAAAAKSYVVTTSGTWGPVQDAAVASSGGTVKFSHSASGIAVVESASSSFLKNIQAKGLKGAPDQTVQWQQPLKMSELTSDATSGDETFVNLQWNLKAVHAQEAWDASGYDGTGARVAILDGGIWSSHVDIAPNLDVAHSTSFVPGQAFNQDVGTFWHGTHVAGIVAAADNGTGTIGIAPGATLIGVKVLHNGSGSFAQVIEGILYASDPIASGGGGADIINMSLGALFPRGGGKDNGGGPLVAAMAQAVNYATNHNVLVVSSAGNSALDLDHSGSYISVPAQSGSGIAVSATGPIGYAVGYPNGATNYDHPASYTNYGSSAIWVAGPGGNDQWPDNSVCSVPRTVGANVVNYCWVFDLVIAPCRGGAASVTSQCFAEGTSMAAPAVSGVAALIKQRFPGITVSDLKTKLAQAADGKGPYYGKGMVNALKAVTQ
jgi:lantibiotic leader peptide-processing serine protease